MSIWLPPGHTIITNDAGITWRAWADGITEITGQAGSPQTARARGQLALRIAAYNARLNCGTKRRSHYYQPGQCGNANAEIRTWCGKLIWLDGSAYDSHYPICTRCRAIESDIESEADAAGHLIVNGRIL